MAHQQQIDFCRSVKEIFPTFFAHRLVLDIGSLDINGNNQYLFEKCQYFGVDLLPGRNVDFASKGHEFHLPDESVDVIISTECFEHDCFYDLTLRNIVRMLKPGGLFLFSCATAGRPEHGTRRTTPVDAPFTQQFADWGDYYKNLEEGDIRAVLDIERIFKEFRFSSNEQTCDLYFWGIKKGVLDERQDYSFIITQKEGDIKLAQLQQGLVDREAHISLLQEEAKRVHLEIQQALAAREARISLLQEEVEISKGLLDDLQYQVTDKDSRIAKLECLLSRSESLNGEYDSRLARLISSRSWRMTKPFRFAARLLRGEFETAMAPLTEKTFKGAEATIRQIRNAMRFFARGHFKGLHDRVRARGRGSAMVSVEARSPAPDEKCRETMKTRHALHISPPPRSQARMISGQRLRAFARAVYHRLPLSQRVKWSLRERLHPFLLALEESPNLAGLTKGAVNVLRPDAEGGILSRDNGRERALTHILQTMAGHAQQFGPVRYWIALPFLATGGAEMVALNLCRALRQLRPDQSVALLITDRKLVSERIVIPEGVQLVVFDDYLGEDLSYARKQALLRDLMVAARPECFHNINSEVAWHLILAEGDRLKRFTRLFASIFAFQFAPDGHKKIGYAAYFLKQGMPNLSGLLSDNQRFVDDAAAEYELPAKERERMAVLYQPCRLLNHSDRELGRERLARRRASLAVEPGKVRRLQVLWAGRLDAEKRIDLFLDVVRRCPFADFRVFGQVVLEDGAALPALPNLSYEGPFSSPLEWLERFDFDAFVFTSRWEGMPNILIEAGALGIPIIAPLVGGVGELINVETGYPLPELPSLDDYERALRAVAHEPHEAAKRAGRMLNRVLQRHSWESFVSALADVPGYLSRTPVGPRMGPVSDPVAVVDGDDALPLVSVIIPCYNQARYLHESISSVLAACSHPLEIIVVDDGSTEPRNARHLAEAEQLVPGIVRIHRQANQGLPSARNNGIALARGEFIQLLDADDLLAPGKIDAQITQLQVNPGLDVSVCNFLLCDDSRSVYSKPEEAIAQFDLTEHDFLYRWERGFAIPIHCGLFRRRVLEDMRFDTHTRAKEDWLFWTSLALAGKRFGYIHGHWAMYRQHEGSMRRSYVSMGRSWLQAGLKIDGMLAGREPLFFESAVSWFEQCYRSNPSYRAEIAAIHAVPAHVMPAKPIEATSADPGEDVGADPEAILHLLSGLSRTTEPPLISVVVPIYGHYEYLQGCLESLAEQGDVPMEIVCVDDASPDPRVATLMHALKDRLPWLKIKVQPYNAGISEAQNVAVGLASGEFVAFLDCDDSLEPGALAAVRACLQAHPEVDYVFTDRIDVDETGKQVRVARYGGYDSLRFSTHEDIRSDLLDGMVASHIKVIRRSVYLEVGGSDATFSGVQDWDLALKIAEKHRLHYLAAPLYRHRVHSHSVTSSDKVSQFRKTNQVRRRHTERWLRRPVVGGGSRKSHVFLAKDFPVALPVLKACWQEGEACVADARGTLNIEQLNFLREFNSYFDRILWDDPSIPAALYGYLWDPVALMNFGVLSGARRQGQHNTDVAQPAPDSRLSAVAPVSS
jgi:glycosyltransferase involved in cell wall biosynthesis/SAM-dependent methyltransferase